MGKLIKAISFMPQLDRADSESQPFLRARLGVRCRMHQASDQGMQVETSIDPVLRLGEVAMAVLGEADVVVGAADGGLDVSDELAGARLSDHSGLRSLSESAIIAVEIGALREGSDDDSN